MKCYQHPDIDAVAQCSKCSKGLCRSCADEFVTTLCQACAQEIRTTETANAKVFLRELRKDKIKAILAILWAVFMMLVGIWATLASQQVGVEKWLNLIVFFAIGGLPWLFGKSRKKPETAEAILQGIRSDMLMYSSGFGSGMLMGKAFIALVALLFSVVMTPFRVIMTIRRLGEMKKVKAQLEDAIAKCA
jgi:hypothetical protein